MPNQIFDKQVFSGFTPKPGGFRRLLFIVLGFIILVLLFVSFKTVPAGHRAVVFNNITGGLSARGEGLTLLIPFTQSATIYDVKTVNYTMSKTLNEGQVKGDDAVQALTSDGQQVDVDISVLYHPDPAKIVQLHQLIGEDYRKQDRPPVLAQRYSHCGVKVCSRRCVWCEACANSGRDHQRITPTV